MKLTNILSCTTQKLEGNEALKSLCVIYITVNGWKEFLSACYEAEKAQEHNTCPMYRKLWVQSLALRVKNWREHFTSNKDVGLPLHASVSLKISNKIRNCTCIISLKSSPAPWYARSMLQVVICTQYVTGCVWNLPRDCWVWTLGGTVKEAEEALN